MVYEPRWAIGKEEAASPQIIEYSHKLIRKFISEIYDHTISNLTRIIYGGSVNINNAKK
ncbi:MAG: triose-phosphate isomerase [Actinobacteria bacterium]|nr:triose-phosphate isomerase [Actinomycetota bacterium]